MKYRLKIVKITSGDLSDSLYPYYRLAIDYTFWQKLAMLDNDQLIKTTSLIDTEEEAINFLKNYAKDWLLKQYKNTLRHKITRTTITTFTLETKDGKTANEVG